jgi:hypothetical protein
MMVLEFRRITPFSYDEDTGTSLLLAEYLNKQFHLSFRNPAEKCFADCSFGGLVLRK